MSLKRCPLCGAVNALSNCECFVCRWYGEFSRDAEALEEGLEELLDRCPELIDAIIDPPIYRVGIRQRVNEIVARVRESFSFRKDSFNMF